MSTKPKPSPLERALMPLLDERDRETITGDLLEEKNARQEQSGSLKAGLWYARQVLSFLPHAASARLARSPILSIICTFTALCGLWLGLMDLRLRHPGYLGQVAIASTILLQALLTLLAIVSNTRMFRILAALGTTGILFLAAKAFHGAASSPHFEGYIVLIAFALVLQSILTLLHMRRPSVPAR